MKFTLSWLNEIVSTENLSPQQIADKLTMLGLEVDAVEDLYTGLDTIITARIKAVRKHPNADKLTLCDVDTGDEEIQVVCGAPNAREGLITALARPGVKLPDGMKIKKAKVRGEVSLGMLCSSRELSLSEEHKGIMELDGDIEIGQTLASALGLRDTMIEVDLTPNRPDCASVLGIAREVAGFTNNPMKPPVSDFTELQAKSIDYQVLIEAPDLCPRYTARKIVNVTIGDSPWWIQRQLLAVGMRPINNIVDITNYVMLEMGQPLHAFDYQKLKGQKIIVRRPTSSETHFTTLDDTKRTLDKDMLMICDDVAPVAVAGIMGGLDSEVTEATTEILLESACFDPVSIRRTARTLNLHSEAAYRFERGVDPDLADKALERAIQLIVKYCNATAENDGIDVYPGRKDLLVLDLRVGKVNTLLGIKLTADEVATYLRSIEFEVRESTPQVLEVTVPSFRVDIEREVDLVEEIARLVGYNEIPTTLPNIAMSYPKRDGSRTLRAQLASVLTAKGFFEAINYSFVAEKHLDFCNLATEDSRRNVTRLLNPLTEEQAVMRSMLLPGLLENICHNINFQNSDIRLFEIGKVFQAKESDQLPEEREQLCVVICGDRHPGADPLYFSSKQSDIFDIKGAAESIISTLRLLDDGKPPVFSENKEGAPPYCDSAIGASILAGGVEIGRIGAVHADTLAAMGIKQNVFFLEMELDKVLELTRKEKSFVKLSKFPSVKRDIALVVPENVSAGDLLQAINDKKQKYVESVDIFDVYRGKPIEDGLKSVALAVTYRSATKTLDDQTVDKMHQKIVDALMSEYKARYREGSKV